MTACSGIYGPLECLSAIARFASFGELTHTKAVTAWVTDDDGTESTPNGMATVTLKTGGLD